MADISKQTKTVSIVAEFTDGDDRTITLVNPRSNLTWETDIAPINELAAGVLLGDRTGATFYRFKDAKITTTTTTYIDLDNAE